MLYIITEDSNSARVFWKYAAKTFRGDGNYKMVPFLKGTDGKPSSGNSTLVNQLKDLAPNLNKDDTVLLVFDNISNIGKQPITTFLAFVGRIANRYNISIKVTSYYCFEEVYLSYSELEKLNTNNKQVILEALRFVKNCILNNVDYYDITYKEIADFINFYKKDSGKNREHFANALLISCTNNISGDFKIIKSGYAFEKQGRCWIQDCDYIIKDIRLTYGDKAVNNKCGNKCSFKCKNCSTLEKLLDLNNNSMINNSSYDLTQI